MVQLLKSFLGIFKEKEKIYRKLILQNHYKTFLHPFVLGRAGSNIWCVQLLLNLLSEKKVLIDLWIMVGPLFAGTLTTRTRSWPWWATSSGCSSRGSRRRSPTKKTGVARNRLWNRFKNRLKKKEHAVLKTQVSESPIQLNLIIVCSTTAAEVTQKNIKISRQYFSPSMINTKLRTKNYTNKNERSIMSRNIHDEHW